MQDLTDASGRTAGRNLLTSVLSSCQWDFNNVAEAEQWKVAVRGLSRKVLVSPQEFSAVFLEAVQASQPETSVDEVDGLTKWQYTLLLLEVLLLELKSGRVATGSDMSLQDALDKCIVPALQVDDIIVRKQAMKCLGMYAVLDNGRNVSQAQLSLITTAVQHESKPVRVVAVQALCDLALLRSPKALDAMQAPAQAASSQDTTPMVPLQGKPVATLLIGCLMNSSGTLTSRLSGKKGARSSASILENVELASTAAEGLAKLLLHNHLYQGPASQLGLETSEVVKALSHLLVMNFDPATEASTAMRQCLAVFF